MDVSVIIPNYNGIELLEKNLPQVEKSFRNRVNRIIEIIIVDDFSYDESVGFIKKKYGHYKIIKHTKNRGFSSAVNTGVRSSKGNLICLLNTDVVPSETFLSSAIKHFDDDDVFAVTLHETGFGPAVGFFENGFIEHKDLGEFNELKESFWANGGSAIFRKKYWIQLGGFDEKLFSPYYWEDIDLSYRALKRGWKVLWEPDSFVFHQHESTTRKIKVKKRQNIQQRNQLLFIWKNITSGAMLRRHLLGMFRRLLKHPGYIKIIIFALLKIKFVLKARTREKKESKVSDEIIFSRFT